MEPKRTEEKTISERANALLVIAEAAPMLRISVATARRRSHNGQLPAFKVGHHWRIRLDDLQQIMREKAEQGEDNR